MNNWYIITAQYARSASIGLFREANTFAIRFEAETVKDAELIGDDIADKTYPEHVEYKIVSETEKMRLEGQPEFLLDLGVR